MNKKILMICNTPYQIFIATWLRLTVLKDCSVDVIISDHMNEAEKLVGNAKRSQVFGEVFYVQSKGCRFDRKSRLLCVVKPTMVLKKYMNIEQKYDALYAANADSFTELVYHTIVNEPVSRIKNKSLDFYFYEDGLASYSKLFEKFYQCTRPKEKRKLFFYKPKQIFGNVSGFYAFDPQCFMWETDMPVIQMNRISVDNDKFKSAVNTIFDYDKMTDVYDKKYLFMEESFYAEGYDVDDVEILEEIASVVGKENIMVKIHPRNPINRFRELGYKTNTNTSVPWELIILNQELTDLTLLTVASSVPL